jgi:hypothetical protein
MRILKSWSVCCFVLAVGATQLLGDISVNYTDPMLTVDSFTDESGFYSYTFTDGSSSELFWGLPADIGGSIGIQSYGLEWVVDPAGWESTVDALGMISWRYTDDTWHIRDTPVTFSYQSSISEYTINPLGGHVVGFAYDADYNSQAVGYGSFDLLAPVPEPSVISLYALGIVFLGWIHRRRDLSVHSTR